jgi:hypothetical protein
MPDQGSFIITGIEDVCARLAAAPETIVKRTFAKALAAGATPLLVSMVEHAPIQKEGEHYHDELAHLKDSAVVAITLNADSKGGVAQIGFGKLGNIAGWVEYGHRLIGHLPKLRQIGQVVAHPFMRPAVADAAEEAIQAFADTLAEELSKDFTV